MNQPDTLRAALELIASAENSALDLAYCKGVARAALASTPAPAAQPEPTHLPPAYMLAKLQMVMPLFQEARDALCAVTEPQRKLHGLSPTLAERMDEAGTFSLDDWQKAHPATAQAEPAKGLTVQSDADGVWLAFAASTGRHALLNVERIADSHGGIVSKALRDWAADVAASPTAQPVQAPSVPLLEWAVSRWRDEVQNRPLVNKNRRPLDDPWRQVIRFAGGDPGALIGPSHDELLAARPAQPKGDKQ